jgi:hypothetical protein
MKTIFPIILFCAVFIHADMSKQEVIDALPYVARDADYQQIVTYFGNHEKTADILPVKVALQERKQYLQDWRNEYYKNYGLGWLMVHVIENFFVGLTGSAMLFGAALITFRNADEAKIAAKIGIGITIVFMTRNILGYTGGCLSNMQYSVESVDLQISRLESLIAATK